MKTDDLIAALAADTSPRATAAGRLVRGLAPAVLVSLAALLAFWGLRADLGAALTATPLAKTLGPLGLGAAAIALLLGLARPDGAVRGRTLLLAALGAGLLAAFLFALSRGGMPGLAQALSTPSLWTCLTSIPALAALPLAAALWALHAGAPLDPARAGAAAGLAAGGFAAAVYSLHCDQDTALFVLPAYGTAVLIVTAAGALLGARLLRW